MAAKLTLEDVALGEVSLEEGASTIRAALAKSGEGTSDEIYAALRSWTWKTLHARRLDDELNGWMSVFSAASGKLAKHSSEIAVKIECLMELLHASLMLAASVDNQSSLERKHVKEALRLIHRKGGEIRRAELLDALRLKAPNLSRIMAPLLDGDYVARKVSGREVSYRLTQRGRTHLIPKVARDLGTDWMIVYDTQTMGLTQGLHLKPELVGKRDFAEFHYALISPPEEIDNDRRFSNNFPATSLAPPSGLTSKARQEVNA